ncbi:MAG: hypothetical protein EPO61_13640 [Nitrospirae bacterium]|nr:MAG: hypothetical protein EPO61_13640 [Nitrospirota bacterium]
MGTVLTQEQIVATVDALPIQGRIMLRLLLLRYLDVTAEDVQYMASDRPDPRFQAGGKPITPYISQETLQGIADRVKQYRIQVRLKRERIKLQVDCLQRLLARNETLVTLASKLLAAQFALTPDAVEDLKKQARTSVPKPVIRELERKWELGEVVEDEYRKARLGLELQRLLRRIETDRKRLAQAKREFDLANASPLQDHEIAHIWGIPAGSLAARKAKYLHQYLQGLQTRLAAASPPTLQANSPPVDLWRETLEVLSHSPVEHSPAVYDGLERTEGALIEKLTTFAAGALPEDLEGRFWLSLIQESRHQAEYGSKAISVFALQRLLAILNDMDMSNEALETDLLARVAPAHKVSAIEEGAAPIPTEAQLSEMGQHVLKSFMGESHPDLQGRR